MSTASRISLSSTRQGLKVTPTSGLREARSGRELLLRLPELGVPQYASGPALPARVVEPVFDLFAKVEAELFRRRYFSGELRQLASIERLLSGQGEEDVVDVPGDIQNEQFVERFLVGADHRVVERVGGGAPDVADDDAARHQGTAHRQQEFLRRQVFRDVARSEGVEKDDVVALPDVLDELPPVAHVGARELVLAESEKLLRDIDDTGIDFGDVDRRGRIVLAQEHRQAPPAQADDENAARFFAQG